MYFVRKNANGLVNVKNILIYASKNFNVIYIVN